LAISQYYFSAQVSSSDPCCISIGAGSHTGEPHESMWSVVVDGTTYTTDDGNNILHCVDGNGTYTVDFIVDGYPSNPYWTRDVEVTDCGDISCDDCGLNPGEIITQATNDPCTFRFTNNFSGIIATCEIVDINWTANSTITELAGGLFAEIVFE